MSVQNGDQRIFRSDELQGYPPLSFLRWATKARNLGHVVACVGNVRKQQQQQQQQQQNMEHDQISFPSIFIDSKDHNDVWIVCCII